MDVGGRESYREYRSEVEGGILPRSLRTMAFLLFVIQTVFIGVDWLFFRQAFGLFLPVRLGLNVVLGVVYFWTSGSWYLALIIFFASIMVPLLKMISLVLLLVSVQLRSRWQLNQRARLYRLVEVVGRWSMLDIYVVAVIVALVQLQALATILPGPGAIAFGAVVVLTMFAAMAFDPRLIWDPLDEEHGRAPA